MVRSLIGLQNLYSSVRFRSPPPTYLNLINNLHVLLQRLTRSAGALLGHKRVGICRFTDHLFSGFAKYLIKIRGLRYDQGLRARSRGRNLYSSIRFIKSISIDLNVTALRYDFSLLKRMSFDSFTTPRLTTTVCPRSSGSGWMARRPSRGS
jgi:hypothetical protein